MMQYPLYANYPSTNAYPYYNYFGQGYGYALGQGYGNYYGYQPWVVPQANQWMKIQEGNSGSENPVALKNGYYPNYQQMNHNYAYPPYSVYQHPWNSCAMTNWYNPHQIYNQVGPWAAYYNYDKWPAMRLNFNTGLYYSWPLMSYYANQMMFPNYLRPSPTYWGVQQAVEMPHTDSKQKKSSGHNSDSKPLNVTSSDVIRDYNLPPEVAKKTRSDIPRPTVDCSDMKESDRSKDEMDLPYLFRVSDTSIKQIASSRSFGPSMVYNTDSDNKPTSAHW